MNPSRTCWHASLFTTLSHCLVSWQLEAWKVRLEYMLNLDGCMCLSLILYAGLSAYFSIMCCASLKAININFYSLLIALKLGTEVKDLVQDQRRQHYPLWKSWLSPDLQEIISSQAAELDEVAYGRSKHSFY